MSSRLTTPVSKLTRAFSTTPAVARPSHLLTNATKTAAATTGSSAGRKPTPITSESERQHSTTTTTPHRPTSQAKTTPQTSTTTPFRFMQTFHHSAPRPNPPSLPTLDRAILPNLHPSAQEEYDPYMHIRVPLLPDSSVPHLQAETPDQPLARPEISIVAANPELVAPAALTEVEGMGVDGVELGFVHLLNAEGQKEESFEMGRGMIRDLWRGMVEDVMGVGAGKAGGKGPAAAV